jgi:general secretion pathway protein D
MNRASKNGWPVAVALAILVSGCAAGNAYRRGQSEAKNGNWDMAVAKLTVALQKDPENIGYKIALESAKVQASRFHYGEARKHIAADELDRAADELDIATKYDAGNKSAADDLAIVQEKIRKRDDQKRQLAEFEKMKANAPTKVPVPTLSARSPVPITLRFGNGTKLQKVLDTLGKLAGVNILYDESFRDKDTEVNLTGVTFEEALDQITFVNRLFYKVLNQNTLMIVPESPQKRRTYDESVLRTFYLQNADTNETLNLVKALTGITKAFASPTLGAITVISSPDKVALAERIIEATDKSKGEVVVEVRVLEVDKTRAKDYGLRLSQYEVGASFLPTGNETLGAASTSLRAQLLSSLNVADWVVTLPQGIFAKFLQSEGSTRILAAPRLRAAEGKKTTLKIGEDIPIPVTSFTLPTAGTSSFGPATSFQYKTVGITLELTPKISASGDITLDPMTAEFSILGTKQDVGGGLLIPSVITRNITGVLRLRDGETSLLGGLVSNQETTSRTGALGVEKIPLLNRIFGQNTKSNEDREVLISITPHVVRAPKITEGDLTPLGVGTEELVKVQNARPSLFGEPEPEPTPPTGTPANPTGREIPSGQQSATPLESPLTPLPLPPTPVPPKGMPKMEAAPPDTTSPSAPPSAVPAPSAPTTSAPMPTTTEPTTPAKPTTPEAAPAAPEGPVTALFSPPELSLNVTATGTLAVVLVGVRDVRSVDLSLTFDSRLVMAVDASPGSLLTLDGSSVGSQKALEGGRVRLRFTRATGASGSGVIAAVVFKAMAPGTATVAVESLSLETGTGSRPVTLPGPGRVVVAQ